jgi:hypothetical protein
MKPTLSHWLSRRDYQRNRLVPPRLASPNLLGAWLAVLWLGGTGEQAM